MTEVYPPAKGLVLGTDNTIREQEFKSLKDYSRVFQEGSGVFDVVRLAMHHGSVDLSTVQPEDQDLSEAQEEARLQVEWLDPIEATLYVDDMFLMVFDVTKADYYNSIATVLAAAGGRPDLMHGILGPAILLGSNDEEGNTLSVPQPWEEIAYKFQTDLNRRFN